MKTLRDFTFNISRKYGKMYIRLISSEFGSKFEQDGRLYDTLNVVVEFKILNMDKFINYKLEITPFNCSIDIHSYQFDDVDLMTYFNSNKKDLEDVLSCDLRMMMKESLGNSYVRMYKNYRKKVFENVALQISNEATRKYQELKTEYDNDITKILEM